MLRNLSALGQRCLLHTANLSWLSGEVPSSWRIAEIRPIPKPGKPPNTTSSFRPISLLSCIGKLVERLIHERLAHFLETNNLLHPAQAGSCYSTDPRRFPTEKATPANSPSRRFIESLRSSMVKGSPGQNGEERYSKLLHQVGPWSAQ